jgi:hypothetical protein
VSASTEPVAAAERRGRKEVKRERVTGGGREQEGTKNQSRKAKMILRKE